MTNQAQAIASLARRQVVRQFTDDGSTLVRVTCLKREEIIALVTMLRGWSPGEIRTRVVVTANRIWDGLEEKDVVPRGSETPTTLRNQRGLAVVLLEGDRFMDAQSWQDVPTISDTVLIEDEVGRRELIKHLRGADSPGVLVDILEEVHKSIRREEEGHISVRHWIAFVDRVCQRLDGVGVLDAATAWQVVGHALPEANLFPDDQLASRLPTDRRRYLDHNRKDSYHLLFEADDRWRDELQEKASETKFVDALENPEPNTAEISATIKKLLGPDPSSEQRNVLFRHWLQVADRKRKRKGLGTRLGEHLDETCPQRRMDYDSLEVMNGIDAGSAKDAQRLLNDVPNDEHTVALVTLFTSQQVAALERMANPRAPITLSPFSKILREISDMVSERAALAGTDRSAEIARLSIEPRRLVREAKHSRALFAWLFGPTLTNASNALANELLCLSVHPSLLNPAPLGGFVIDGAEDDENDDDKRDGLFDTLELRLSWSDEKGLERRIDWKPAETPGLVALWRLTERADTKQWLLSSDLTFRGWMASALQRQPMIGAAEIPESEPEVATSWQETRAAALRELNERGLQSALIGDYVDRYRDVLSTLRKDHVPAGTGSPTVAAVLECDLHVGPDEAVLLATHPIRLRWIAAYLVKIEDFLLKAMRRELHTNPVNSGLFFDDLLDASPQAQPPVAVIGEQLYVAVREQDWHEWLAPLRDERGERRDWLADLDNGAIDDVANTVGRYLDAYPHKSDGLHLLYIVRRHGARGLHRLVKNVLGRIKSPGASLSLTLCVDPAEIRSVEQVLLDFDDIDHRAHSDRPPLIVQLHAWENPQESLPDVSEVDPLIDIAVVPNLFGASTRTHDGTRDGRLDTGLFDPLLDEPTRLEAVGSGESASTAVSRVLLPEARDELLEAWSTVSARQFRGSPVGDSLDENDIDHVTVQVSLDKNRAFFDALHANAHWVTTVDAFVGREQIEALEGGPDVIQVKTGVGANGAYRLVVSSNSGRPFVESRIARRLEEQVPSASDARRLATCIYDRARLLVPGIVLRSLGLGRTAAEMVGLVLARARVEQVQPARIGEHGFQTWISLDEHVNWSGGYQAKRADLARIRGRLVGQKLHLIVDVVEAKMRTQVAIGRAERQIQRSVDMFQAALGASDSDAETYVDTPTWRRLIWRAIDQTSAAANTEPAATHVRTPEGPRVGLDEPIRAALRQGDIVLEAVNGVLVSMTDHAEARDSRTPSGHVWLRMTLDEAAEELRRLCEEVEYPLITTESHDPAAGASGPADKPDEPAPASDIPSDAPADDPAESRAASPPGHARGGTSDAARKRMQDLLDALHRLNVEVKPAGGDDAIEGPGFYMLRLKLCEGVRTQDVSKHTEDLQYHLKLEAGHIPRMRVDSGNIVLEIPKREGERYYVSADELWTQTTWPEDRLFASIGRDVHDCPVGVDFSSSKSPHLLIGGMTGGGKSVALETILLGLIRHYSSERLELRIIDPKGNEFTQFEESDHVPTPVGMDAEDAMEMLETTCDEMDVRYRAMKELSRSLGSRVADIATYNASIDADKRFKWVVVVLDEFADLTADKNNKKTIEGLLQRIAQKARACGIHVIVATQKPSAEVISTTTRSNLGAQLALRVRGATDSRVIMEAPGAESLAGNGDAFLRLSGEEPIRLQCAKVDSVGSHAH